MWLLLLALIVGLTSAQTAQDWQCYCHPPPDFEANLQGVCDPTNNCCTYELVDNATALYNCQGIVTLTSGNASALVDSPWNLYSPSDCYPILNTAYCSGTTPTQSFIWDYQISEGAFSDGTADTFDDFGEVTVYDMAGSYQLYTYAPTNFSLKGSLFTSISVTEGFGTLTRELYVNSEDTSSLVSWVRVVDTFENLSGDKVDIYFELEGDLGCDSGCAHMPCSSAVGLEKESAINYFGEGSPICPRSLTVMDRSLYDPSFGLLAQGSPPFGDTLYEWNAFQIEFEDDEINVYTNPINVGAGEKVSVMWFAFQSVPHTTKYIFEAQDAILRTPREFYNGDDVGHPFYGVPEERWATIINWDSAASSLAPFGLFLVFVLFSLF